MLLAMRQLGLDFLWRQIDQGKSEDPEAWYLNLRRDNPGELLPYLLEAPGKIERLYTLQPDPDDDNIAVLEGQDLGSVGARRVPFNQPSGSQSPALGPVLKRTWKSTTKTAGPTLKIQNTTVNAFEEIARDGNSWSNYFSRVAECFRRKKVRNQMTGELVPAEEHALQTAVDAIDETKTVFLAYQDSDGRLPGDVPEYLAYLQEVLAGVKYAAGESLPIPDQTCGLCGREGVGVYPNSLRGAGINIANLDRAGAFPGLCDEEAWKSFALCGACADLLYVYNQQVARKCLAPVGGEAALVIPSLELDAERRKIFQERFGRFLKNLAQGHIERREQALVRLLANEQSVTDLTFLWAKFGQRIEDVAGVVTDVLPSRLREIDEIGQTVQKKAHPLFPEYQQENCDYDLLLSVLRSLFWRPGGKAAKGSNESKRLFELKRELIAAIYHKRSLPLRFWDEVVTTARWHVRQATTTGDAWGLLNEGFSEKTNKQWMTPAGWVRELCRFRYFLTRVGVEPMPETIYQPQLESLKPYFTAESAIDTREKAYAFLLGVLYGKVMQVQGARGVNVGANALTWLKRLTLRGTDLPELYVKVREKLLAYEMEGSEQIRELIKELGELGIRVRTLHKLDETDACYFLLLGQSLTTQILSKKDKETNIPDKGDAE